MDQEKHDKKFLRLSPKEQFRYGVPRILRTQPLPAQPRSIVSPVPESFICPVTHKIFMSEQLASSCCSTLIGSCTEFDNKVKPLFPFVMKVVPSRHKFARDGAQ